MSQALYTDSKAGVFTDYIFVEREAGKDGGQAILSGANKAVQERKKLFGLFGGAGGNFEPPVPTNDGSGVVNRGSIENPLLKDATIAALKVLSQNQNGFFAMIEQGDVDWANHANDYQWMIGTMWDLDEAVKAAIEFVHQPGDDIHWGNTLIIVTSDHSNSYMRLSKEKRLGEGELPQQVGGSPCTYNPGANTCFSYPGEEVAYYTGDHTNELVSLYAFGGWSFMNHFKKFEGAWYPCTRIIDNTQLFHIMTEAVGVNKESPLNVIVEEPDFCAPAWGMKY
jgi:alkaline phosphatase